jgi:hypothetical protein
LHGKFYTLHTSEQGRLMRNPIESLARSSRRTLLGALTVLAAAFHAGPAGADPTLTYSTYLGGSLGEVGFAVAAKGGKTFIAGITFIGGPTIYDQDTEAFVTALGPTGIPLYSTAVWWGSYDEPIRVLAIDVGPDGSAYVAIEGHYRGTADSFLLIQRLKPSGEIDHWSAGTGGRLSPQAMTVDSQGNVYVTGYDQREYLNPYPGQSSYANEAFVWKISTDGSPSYWTGIDGSGTDFGRDVAVDAAGNAYVLGDSDSTDLPKPILQPSPGDGSNPFVTKVSPSGSILWTTYLGGSHFDQGEKIRVAADGSLVVVGMTWSPDFPTLNAIQPALRGPQDLFLVRLKPWGPRISSTYLGGSGGENVTHMAFEGSNIVLFVSSPGTDSPLREPLDPACGDGSFVAKLDASASRVLDAACPGVPNVFGMAADSTGVSLTGWASSGLPVVNAWQPSPGGGSDVFAMKLVLNNTPDCSAATASSGTLWPADGRFVSVSIRGLTDPDGDRLTTSLTSINQDEWLTRAGTADATGIGASVARLRASRLDGGNGRVYHLGFTATDPRGGVCTGTVKVCVPLVQGGTCVDGGARVDSTRMN